MPPREGVESRPRLRIDIEAGRRNRKPGDRPDAEFSRDTFRGRRVGKRGKRRLRPIAIADYTGRDHSIACIDILCRCNCADCAIPYRGRRIRDNRQRHIS